MSPVCRSPVLRETRYGKRVDLAALPRLGVGISSEPGSARAGDIDARVLDAAHPGLVHFLEYGADVARWRAKEPFFRDALVRAGHATPFTRPDDYNVVDAAKLTAVMMREAQAIAGPGVVRSVVVTRQTPRHRVNLPRS